MRANLPCAKILCITHKSTTNSFSWSIRSIIIMLCLLYHTWKHISNHIENAITLFYQIKRHITTWRVLSSDCVRIIQITSLTLCQIWLVREQRIYLPKYVRGRFVRAKRLLFLLSMAQWQQIFWKEVTKRLLDWKIEEIKLITSLTSQKCNTSNWNICWSFKRNRDFFLGRCFVCVD